MSWIKLEHATPDKPEIWEMAGILGIDPDAVLGKVLRAWIWADQNCNASGVTSVTVLPLLDPKVAAAAIVPLCLDCPVNVP